MPENPQAREAVVHRRYERWVGGITLLATLCAVGFAGGAYVQTKRQADIAQAALIESDHPFLEFTATSNPDVRKGGKAYSSVALTIKNQGSRAAILHLAEFAIVDPDIEAASADEMSRGGIVLLGKNCTGQVIRKLLLPAAGIRMNCTSTVPKRDPRSEDQQHLVGVIQFGGALGARWKRTVNMIELTGGEWFDVRQNYDFETRTDSRGRPIPTERYQ